MPFQIHALPAENFRHLFGLPEDQLAARRARRLRASDDSGFPCRVSLRDALEGETLLLLNHCSLDGDTPYRATHAIFVREAAETVYPASGEVPEALRRRLLSIRAFDSGNIMRAADVVEGTDLGQALDRMFLDTEVEQVCIHHARQGCYAARATRP